MLGALGYGPNAVALGRNAELRRYARWEYGTSDAAWLVDGVRRSRRRVRPERNLARRVRHWLVAFLGVAAVGRAETVGDAPEPE